MDKYKIKKERWIYRIYLFLELVFTVAMLILAFAELFTDGSLIVAIAFFILALIPAFSFYSILRRGNKAIPSQIIFPLVRLHKENDLKRRTK
jgi:uncharacterized membrane protein YjjP (DUF1212 family)